MTNPNSETYMDEKNRRRCYACQKLAFYDEDSAINRADNAARYNTYLRVYYEHACGYWHLTSQRQRSADASFESAIQKDIEKLAGKRWFSILFFVLVAIVIVCSLAELLS